MKTQLIETQYFPPVTFFKQSTKLKYYLLEQYENFQKMSFRNRCIISGSNGLIHLTVPIVNGRESKERIRDVKIDYRQHWQKQHWRALVSSYGRAPFFEFYADDVNKLITAKHLFLFDLNQAIIEWLIKVLRIDAEIKTTTSYLKEYDSVEFIDLRNVWSPKNFQKPGDDFVNYIQVFDDKYGFIPNLSILDLLFCRGFL